MTELEKSKPLFKENNLNFMREEKNGYWTIISRCHPEVRELVINKTSKEILDYCNGSRTIMEIYQTMKNRYEDVHMDIIKRDTLQTVGKFSRMGIISWEEENPFLLTKEEYLEGDFFLKIGAEDDFQKIISFLAKSGIVEEKYQNEENISEYRASSTDYQYRAPAIHPNEYTEVALRQKIFHFNEEFFFLVNRETIAGMISIMLPFLPYQSARIKLISVSKEHFKALLLYSIDNIPWISVNRVSKICIDEALKNSIDTELYQELMIEGFKEEGILKNELGFENDVRILSYLYDPSLVEEIEKQRNLY